MATGTRRKKQESTPTKGNSEVERSEQPVSYQQEVQETQRPDREDWPERERRFQAERSFGLTERAAKTPRNIAQGLAYFSVGIGLAEVIAPQKMARLIGVRRSNAKLIRLFGIRELASGISIFAQRKQPAKAVWSRVAGDAADLTAMGLAFTSPHTQKKKLAIATANVAAVSALDVLCARKLSNEPNGFSRRTHTVQSLVINRSPEDLYKEWRQFENLPRFIHQLESVRTIDDRRSHWVAKGAMRKKLEWDAEITIDSPNEHIGWHSAPGSMVEHSGSIVFERAPDDRGTIVKVKLDYTLPGGKFSSALAKVFGEDPDRRAMEALRRFKQYMETGEITVSDATVYTTGFTTQRPAQPLGSGEPEPSYIKRNIQQGIPQQSTQGSE